MKCERIYRISIETNEPSETLFQEINRAIESVLDTFQKDRRTKVYIVNVKDPDDSPPFEMADQSLEIIEKAILHVLLEAKRTEEVSLSASEISTRLRMSAYKDKTSSSPTSYTLIREILLHLQFHGSKAFERDPVEREKWRITENGESRLQTKRG